MIRLKIKALNEEKTTLKIGLKLNDFVLKINLQWRFFKMQKKLNE